MITLERLREELRYEPETGKFWWVKRRQGRQFDYPVGTYHTDGYIMIRVLGHTFMAHRLAWLFMTGAWPLDQIDHINRLRDDNRFVNLREAGPSENALNAPAHFDKTSNLPRGIDYKNGQYRLRVQVKGVRREALLPSLEAALALRKAWLP